MNACGNGIRYPEPNISLSINIISMSYSETVKIDLRICHTDLTCNRAKVDEKIEPVIDPRDRRCMINDDAFAALRCHHFHFVKLDLLRDQC